MLYIHQRKEDEGDRTVNESILTKIVMFTGLALIIFVSVLCWMLKETMFPVYVSTVMLGFILIIYAGVMKKKFQVKE